MKRRTGEQRMRIEEFYGIHTLSEIGQFRSEDESHVFVLDGKTYIARENSEDGYRSIMDDISLATGDEELVFENRFPEQEVFISIYKSRKEEMMRMESERTGELILEIGTEEHEEYYPCAIFSFTPENLDCNQKSD